MKAALGLTQAQRNDFNAQMLVIMNLAPEVFDCFEADSWDEDDASKLVAIYEAARDVMVRVGDHARRRVAEDSSLVRRR